MRFEVTCLLGLAVSLHGLAGIDAANQGKTRGTTMKQQEGQGVSGEGNNENRKLRLDRKLNKKKKKKSHVKDGAYADDDDYYHENDDDYSDEAEEEELAVEDDESSCEMNMKEMISMIPRAMEPPINGMMGGTERPKIVLAQDIDYPPYATLGDADDDFPLDGFGASVAYGLESVCNIDIVLTQIDWSDCWGSNEIGAGLMAGEVHGCMTYTHTAGVRNRYLEFSSPILNMNKPAGILTRLDNGVPAVDGSSNLSGITVVDVVGWAPTSDTLSLNTNGCTGETFTGFTTIDPTVDTGRANDDALQTLLNGDADAIWIYADQAYSYSCAKNPDNDPVLDEFDCTLWDGLGSTFAYVQTGLYDYSRAGTTLSISKVGSGLSDILNPCIEEFLTTEEYYDACVKWGLSDDCFENEFFTTSEPKTDAFYSTTSDLTTSCEDGYCSCP